MSDRTMSLYDDESNLCMRKCYGSYYYDFIDENYRLIQDERTLYAIEESKANDDDDNDCSRYNTQNVNTSLKRKIQTVHNNDSAASTTTPIEQNYYSLLNVPNDATAIDIQRNFKILSRIYHPDKISSTLSLYTSSSSNNNNDNSNQLTTTDVQETFVQIKTAADVLLDPIYRLTYDIGGPIAVILVKRSQVNAKSRQRSQINTKNQKRKHRRQRQKQKQQQQENQDKSNEQHQSDNDDSKINDSDDDASRTHNDNDTSDVDDDDDSDESDDDYEDLYIALQHAKSIEDAQQILEDVIVDYIKQKQIQQKHFDDYNKPTITLQSVHCSVPFESYMDADIPIIRHPIRSTIPNLHHQQEQEQKQNKSESVDTTLATSSCSIQSRYEYSQKYALNVHTSTEHTIATGETNVGTGVAIEIQPVTGTNVVIDTTFPRISQLFTKTILVKNVYSTIRKQQQVQYSKHIVEQDKVQWWKYYVIPQSILLSIMQVSIRTSRQLANGTFVMFALGGNSMKRNTWTATVVSFRNLLFMSSENDDTGPTSTTYNSNNGTTAGTGSPVPTLVPRVQAMYRMGISMVTGQVRFLWIAIKTLQYPCWKLRWSLFSEYPIKVSYKLTDNDADTWSFSYSRSIVSSTARIKVLRYQSIRLLYSFRSDKDTTTTETGGTKKNRTKKKNDGQAENEQCTWYVKYGIKYENRELFNGGPVWTIVFHGQGPNSISFTIPIRILPSMYGPGNALIPVTTLATTFVIQFVGSLIVDAMKAIKKRQRQRFLLKQQIANITKQSTTDTKLQVQDHYQTDTQLDSNGIDFISVLLSTTFSDIISKVAEQKRRKEQSINGLSILKATVWYSTSPLIQTNKVDQSCTNQLSMEKYDVTDILQFWVTDSQLDVPFTTVSNLKPIDHVSSSIKESSTSWKNIRSVSFWSNQLRQIGLRKQPSSKQSMDNVSATEINKGQHVLSLIIRYGFQNIVYETTIDESSSLRIQLPNTSFATEMGRIGEIS